ncbi:MAG: PilZ domain-containing protein [Chloroflexi bacterium]|nr:PilZ domain-containing protein [Chloroflexota bacterium]
MHDRRKLDRKYLTIYSRVFDRVSGRLLGYLADLSEKGAMIISDEPIPEAQEIHLRFDLSDPPIFSANHLDLDVRVTWCGPDIDPAFYNIGFEFLSINPQESQIIEVMIITYEFRRTSSQSNNPSASS